MTVEKSHRPIELLMPAGSIEKLNYAFAYGADAVYVGVPLFSLRARENEFQLEELRIGIETAHQMGKKVYVTANIFSRNRKISAFKKHIEDWFLLKPDAFIMSDPGLMLMVREKYPDLPIHLSVQANCMNWQSVRFWKNSLNVSRIILSRELQINEIKEIKQRVPDIELEAFVHGAICIAFSGRCLLSSYFSHRDANQGVCDNSCREKYHVFKAQKQTSEEDYFIEDLRNRGEFYQVNEDEHGTYIMNAKDLNLIAHLKDISEAGVCSFKVEGRTKSVYYLSLVTRSYRKAIDDLIKEEPFDPNLQIELNKIAHRGYSTGFMIQNTKEHLDQNYNTSQSRSFTQKYIGLLISDPKTPPGFIAVEAKGTLRKGQKCEVLGPQMQSYHFVAHKILNKRLHLVDAIHSGAGVHYIESNGPFIPYGILSVISPAITLNPSLITNHNKVQIF